MLEVLYFYFVYLKVLHYDLSNSVFMNVRLFNVQCSYLKKKIDNLLCFGPVFEYSLPGFAAHQ